MKGERLGWGGWGKERTYDETAFGGVDAAGLERLRAAFENELFETLGVFPARRGEVRVCFVRVFDEGLS